jgi:DNA polymerase-1
VIALLARSFSSHALCLVVSDDKDMLQLVDDGVHVYRPRVDKYIYPANFTHETKVIYGRYLLYQCLNGDTSDNIKGVKGIGNKTAAQVAAGVASFDQLGDYAARHSSKRVRRIADDLHVPYLNRELMDLAREPITDDEVRVVTTAAMAPARKDYQALASMFQTLGFGQGADSPFVDLGLWLLPFNQLR